MSREIYPKVIRSATTYGAGVWHTPARKPRGIVGGLLTAQSQCLRTVCGAYRRLIRISNVQTVFAARKHVHKIQLYLLNLNINL